MSASLMECLREATWAQHKILEKQAFNLALVKGCLPLTAYIAQLQQYFLILQALEQAFARCSDPSVARVWRADLCKTHLLSADLAFFAADDNVQPLPSSHAFIHWISLLEAENPLSLLGILYVFEGSTLGATVLLPIIRKTYDLEQSGCAFYHAYGEATRAHWVAFAASMNRAVPDVAQHQAVTQAAQQCFEQIAQLFAEICALTGEQ